MKHKHWIVLLLSCAISAAAQPALRQTISLDGSWQTAEGNTANIPTAFDRRVPVLFAAGLLAWFVRGAHPVGYSTAALSFAGQTGGELVGAPSDDHSSPDNPGSDPTPLAADDSASEAVLEACNAAAARSQLDAAIALITTAS